MSDSTVYLDLETAGLAEDAEIIQLAAIAVAADGSEAATFERKLRFNVDLADPEALRINHYDPDTWNREAVDQSVGAHEFARWLNEHRSVQMVSRKTSKPYTVARCAGYNPAFDKLRLWKLYERTGTFLPAHPMMLDVMQRVLWYLQENPQEAKPASMKLGDICAWLGMPLDGKAHDALSDIRATIAVAKAIRSRTEGVTF